MHSELSCFALSRIKFRKMFFSKKLCSLQTLFTENTTSVNILILPIYRVTPAKTQKTQTFLDVMKTPKIGKNVTFGNTLVAGVAKQLLTNFLRHLVSI